MGAAEMTKGPVHSCAACPEVWQETRGRGSSATPGTTQQRWIWTHTKCPTVSPQPPSDDAAICMRRTAAAGERRQVAGDLRERVPSGRQLMMAESTVGLVIIQFHGSNVENPAAVRALYRPARGTRNLQRFKRHKGTGPEIQPSSPGMESSPALRCLFLFLSACLSSSFSFLPYFLICSIISLMVFLLISLCALPDFHLPLRT